MGRRNVVVDGYNQANRVRSPDSYFTKGFLMRMRYRALALPAVVLGISLSGGCGTANEENMADTKSAPIDPNAPVFKTYGDKAKYDAEQNAKKNAATKGKGAKAAAPVAPPETKTPETKTPDTKTPEEQPKAK
jgi:hypothetical protein